jgi:hypothetical protein
VIGFLAGAHLAGTIATKPDVLRYAIDRVSARPLPSADDAATIGQNADTSKNHRGELVQSATDCLLRRTPYRSIEYMSKERYYLGLESIGLDQPIYIS